MFGLAIASLQSIVMMSVFFETLRLGIDGGVTTAIFIVVIMW